MKINEHGAPLDRNGYAPSIVQTLDDSCEICGCSGNLVRHEIFFGPYRTKSKVEGLWVSICPNCHTSLHTRKGGYDSYLKERGQRTAMRTYGWTVEDFRARFGKNYT